MVTLWNEIIYFFKMVIINFLEKLDTNEQLNFLWKWILNYANGQF
jgi:hypothetical protein